MADLSPMSPEPRSPHPASDLWAAAVEAEQRTGKRETTVAEAERHLLFRLGKAALGFVLIVVGIAALPLPGPGWLIIIAGLNLLPFRWAQQTIRIIRNRIPGVPEDGPIPLRTWLIMGAIVAAMSIVSILWADDIAQWFSDTWTRLRN